MGDEPKDTLQLTQLWPQANLHANIWQQLHQKAYNSRGIDAAVSKEWVQAHLQDLGIANITSASSALLSQPTVVLRPETLLSGACILVGGIELLERYLDTLLGMGEDVINCDESVDAIGSMPQLLDAFKNAQSHLDYGQLQQAARAFSDNKEVVAHITGYHMHALHRIWDPRLCQGRTGASTPAMALTAMALILAAGRCDILQDIAAARRELINSALPHHTACNFIATARPATPEAMGLQSPSALQPCGSSPLLNLLADVALEPHQSWEEASHNSMDPSQYLPQAWETTPPPDLEQRSQRSMSPSGLLLSPEPQTTPERSSLPSTSSAMPLSDTPAATSVLLTPFSTLSGPRELQSLLPSLNSGSMAAPLQAATGIRKRRRQSIVQGPSDDVSTNSPKPQGLRLAQAAPTMHLIAIKPKGWPMRGTAAQARWLLVPESAFDAATAQDQETLGIGDLFVQGTRQVFRELVKEPPPLPSPSTKH